MVKWRNLIIEEADDGFLCFTMLFVERCLMKINRRKVWNLLIVVGNVLFQANYHTKEALALVKIVGVQVLQPTASSRKRMSMSSLADAASTLGDGWVFSVS